MVDIAKARETAKNLREWARQIRRDAVTVPHATAREDSTLLDNAAKQLVATLAVVNTADDVAPPNSLKPFADAMATNVRIIEYPGELGVCLQHLGILIGRHAQAEVWPEILSWLKISELIPPRRCASNDSRSMSDVGVNSDIAWT
jgi:hypothetical protein